jgi:hypothetical protein
MLLAREIGEKTVTLQCRDDLEPQADGLLGHLKRTFTPHSEQLKHGFKIQFGWSVLCLLDRTSDMLICEPNFRGNPFQQWSDDVSTTLAVLSEQVGFLRSIAFPASDSMPARFDDKIVLSKGCLSHQQIYLERCETSKEGDSGWYIGPVLRSSEKPEYEAMRVYELLDLRPATLGVLCLPPGFLVVLDGDRIEGIQDPGGKTQAPWRLDS